MGSDNRVRRARARVARGKLVCHWPAPPIPSAPSMRIVCAQRRPLPVVGTPAEGAAPRRPRQENKTRCVVAKARVTDLWCSAVPALAKKQTTDLTGRVNDQDRVDEVRERYSDALVRLPGVVALGTTRLSVWSKDRTEDQPASSDAHDHAIFVGVEDGSDVPELPLFLEDVPIVVDVTGRFTAR